MIETFLPLARALVDAMAPLRDVIEDPSGHRFQVLIHELGWDVEAGSWFSGFTLITALTPVVERATSLAATLEREGTEVGTAVGEAAELTITVADAISAIASNPPSGADVPAVLRQASFWTELAGDLPEYLLVRWIERSNPVLYATLHLVGVIESTPRPASGARRAVIVDELRLSKLSAFVSNPAGALQQRFGWTRGTFDQAHADDLLTELASLARAGGRPVRAAPLDDALIGGGGLVADTNPLATSVEGLELPLLQGFVGVLGAETFTELGLMLAPIPATPSSPTVSGLFVGNLSFGSAVLETPLSPTWALRASGTGGPSGALGVLLFPGQAPAARAVANTAAELVLTVARAPEAPPLLLLGTASGTRLEIRGAEVSAALTTAGGPDLVLTARTVPRSGAPGLALAIEPGRGDGLVQELLGAQPIVVEADLSASLSARNGLSLEGHAGLEIEIPIGKVVGPITVDHLTLAIELGTDEASASLGVTASAILGPLQLAVDNVGVIIELAPPDAPGAIARVGDRSLAVGFKSPDGIGIGLDVAGVISGGGYLDVDAERGEYAGVFDASLLGVGITAIGLIATRLPEAPGAWSMFVALSATFQGLQLGFGFTLSGVGGLIGTHRGLDVDALGDGVRSGALEGLLFPDDPIADAPRILADIGAIFPPAPGQFVLGPIVKIGWGTPNLVQLDLGVVLQLPNPLTVTLLGALSLALPTEDAAIVELHADVAGTLDLTAGTLAIDAAIRDSRILNLELGGAMAVRASFLDDPTFLISFGGFHPAFRPPAGMPSLPRLSVALDAGSLLQVQLSGYLALTANTLQFGAALSIWAAEAGFTAEGSTSFDALIQFSPFSFMVDLGIRLAISAGSADLLAASLSGRLTGPNPWHVTGEASFKILLVKTTLQVEATIGRKATEPPPKAVDVEELLVQELLRPDAWRALPPKVDGDGVLLTDAPSEAACVVHPAGIIEVRQRVVPLGATLEQFGNAPITGPDRFVLEAPRVGAVSISTNAVSPVEDWFAPSQFFTLSATEKLSSPSFEMMQAGLQFGDDGAAGGPGATMVLDHEVVYDDPSLRGGPARTEETSRVSGRALRRAMARGAARAAREAGRLPRAGRAPIAVVREPRFAALDPMSGDFDEAVGPKGGGSFFTVRSAIGAREGRVVAPAFEQELLQ